MEKACERKTGEGRDINEGTEIPKTEQGGKAKMGVCSQGGNGASCGTAQVSCWWRWTRALARQDLAKKTKVFVPKAGLSAFKA